MAPGRMGYPRQVAGNPCNIRYEISNARIIVETDLDDFKVDASLGSHFFHNITSMNIGYLTVHQSSGTDFVGLGIPGKI